MLPGPFEDLVRSGTACLAPAVLGGPHAAKHRSTTEDLARKAIEPWGLGIRLGGGQTCNN